ncbi:MAG: hypothetical protein ACKN81_14425, partial [Pirellulaceae bacterium]
MMNVSIESICRRMVLLLLPAALGLGGLTAVGKEPAEGQQPSPKGKGAKITEVVEQVELFDAMDRELVTVDFIAKDATEANLIFRN